MLLEDTIWRWETFWPDLSLFHLLKAYIFIWLCMQVDWEFEFFVNQKHNVYTFWKSFFFVCFLVVNKKLHDRIWLLFDDKANSNTVLFAVCHGFALFYTYLFFTFHVSHGYCSAVPEEFKYSDLFLVLLCSTKISNVLKMNLEKK